MAALFKTGELCFFIGKSRPKMPYGCVVEIAPRTKDDKRIWDWPVYCYKDSRGKKKGYFCVMEDELAKISLGMYFKPKEVDFAIASTGVGEDD